jgi:hypothetical protein
VAEIRRAELEDAVRRQLYRVLARRALRWDSGSAVVDWANMALAAGPGSTPIAILAGLEKPPNEFEVDRYLRDALTELGVEWPDKAELLRVFAIILAEDMLKGVASPKAACLELSKLCSTSGYPRWLMDFYTAEDELDLAERGIFSTVEEVAQHIISAARRMVDAAP